MFGASPGRESYAHHPERAFAGLIGELDVDSERSVQRDRSGVARGP